MVPTSSEPHRATASEEPGEHVLDAGYAHLTSEFHGDAYNAERRTARGHYAHRREAAMDEVSRRGDARDARGSCEEVDVDWPINAADLRESLLEAEADRVAGRTFSAEELRARYGLPPSGTR